MPAYTLRPHLTASTMLPKRLSSSRMSEASLATLVPARHIFVSGQQCTGASFFGNQRGHTIEADCMHAMRRFADPSVKQIMPAPCLPCQALHEAQTPISEAGIMRECTLSGSCVQHIMLPHMASLQSHDLQVASTPTTKTNQPSLWDKADTLMAEPSLAWNLRCLRPATLLEIVAVLEVSGFSASLAFAPGPAVSHHTVFVYCQKPACQR